MTSNLWGTFCLKEGFNHAEMYGNYNWCEVCGKSNPNPPPPQAPAPRITQRQPSVSAGEAGTRPQRVEGRSRHEAAPAPPGHRSFPSIPSREIVEAARQAAFDSRRTHAGGATVAGRRGAVTAAQGHPPPNTGATRPTKPPPPAFRYKAKLYTYFYQHTYEASGSSVVDFIIARSGVSLVVRDLPGYMEHFFCASFTNDTLYPITFNYTNGESLEEQWMKFDNSKRDGKEFKIVAQQRAIANPAASSPPASQPSPTPTPKKPNKGSRVASLRASATSSKRKRPSPKKGSKAAAARKRIAPPPSDHDDDGDDDTSVFIKPEKNLDTPPINPSKPPPFINLDTPIAYHPRRGSMSELSEVAGGEHYQLFYEAENQAQHEANSSADEDLPDDPRQLPQRPQASKRTIEPSDRELRGRRLLVNR
ncbi:hypothetical protein LTR95_000914 [Oleoguttula sp. CCFEE 5521]